MSRETLKRRFAAMGARLEIEGDVGRREPRIDVRRDRRGEYFDLRFEGPPSWVEIEVVDVRPRDRHLLLLARVDGEKSKFLCGHDERHWFVAAIPERARGVRGVATAKTALQPEGVRELVERARPKDPFRRRNAGFVRQGEWFFIAVESFDPASTFVLRDEPLRRGNGQAHVIQFAYRRGGEMVYVSRDYPAGLPEAEYLQLSEQDRRRAYWEQMVRDPEVYAKGAVRHPDHATIHLEGWHRVLMNTEQDARAMRHVAFID